MVFFSFLYNGSKLYYYILFSLKSSGCILFYFIMLYSFNIFTLNLKKMFMLMHGFKIGKYSVFINSCFFKNLMLFLNFLLKNALLINLRIYFILLLCVLLFNFLYLYILLFCYQKTFLFLLFYFFFFFFCK